MNSISWDGVISRIYCPWKKKGPEHCIQNSNFHVRKQIEEYLYVFAQFCKKKPNKDKPETKKIVPRTPQTANGNHILSYNGFDF